MKNHLLLAVITLGLSGCINYENPGSSWLSPSPAYTGSSSSSLVQVSSAQLEGDMGPVTDFVGTRHELSANDYSGATNIRVDAYDARGRWFMIAVTADSSVLEAPSGTTVVRDRSTYNSDGLTDIMICASRSGSGFDIDEHPSGQVSIQDNEDGTRTMLVSTTNSDGTVSNGEVRYRLSARSGGSTSDI